jgi:hypothetical protein
VFEDRLVAEKTRAEEQVAALSEGPEREALLKKINQLDTALRVDAWASSTGLQPPK